MIKAVVLDLDDTLCLTEAACFALENEVLLKMGRPAMDREIHIATWGKPLLEVISLRSPGIDLETFKYTYQPLLEEYIATGKLDTIPEENYRVLDELINQGKSIMVLTSRTHMELKHMLEPDHLLASRVKTFYYRDTIQYHKPDPRAFDLLLKDTGLKPIECVYIGDSVGDAQAAKQAGLHFIASLESGLRDQKDFRELPVDAFIYKFTDVGNTIAYVEKNK